MNADTTDKILGHKAVFPKAPTSLNGITNIQRNMVKLIKIDGRNDVIPKINKPGIFMLGKSKGKSRGT